MPLKVNLGCNLRGKIMPRTEHLKRKNMGGRESFPLPPSPPPSTRLNPELCKVAYSIAIVTTTYGGVYMHIVFLPCHITYCWGGTQARNKAIHVRTNYSLIVCKCTVTYK